MTADMSPASWRDNAACVGAEPDIFDSPPRAAALTYCAACPATLPCLQQGIEDQASGVYGGLVLRDGRVVAYPQVRFASDDQVRVWHNAWTRGVRDPLTHAGEAEYHRRGKQRGRAAS